MQVALAEPLDPARADEIHFSAKRDIAIVVADPTEIDKAIEKLYGQGESENFNDILKELGTNQDFQEMAWEVSEVADKEKFMENLANDVPIVKFVNLVLQQACRTARAIFILSPSRRSSASAIGWTGRSMRWRRRPSIWPCRWYPA